MARIKYETAEAFREHKPYQDSSNFYSTGNAIYSYAKCLAHWEEDEIVYDYSARTIHSNGKGRIYSATTNMHMIALESVIPRS